MLAQHFEALRRPLREQLLLATGFGEISCTLRLCTGLQLKAFRLQLKFIFQHIVFKPLK